MVVSVMTVDMRLPGVTSLKGKRHVIRSIKDNVRNKFNVSIAETAFQDMWQRAQLGVSAVSGDRLFIEKELARIIKLIESRGEVEIFDWNIEYIY
jgi:uncharacterized protein